MKKLGLKELRWIYKLIKQALYKLQDLWEKSVAYTLKMRIEGSITEKVYFKVQTQIADARTIILNSYFSSDDTDDAIEKIKNIWLGILEEISINVRKFPKYYQESIELMKQWIELFKEFKSMHKTIMARRAFNAKEEESETDLIFAKTI